MSIRAILVDDEELARRGLRRRLESIQAIELVGEAANGFEAIELVHELEPDLLFLDIQMPGMSGFDVIKNLQSDQLPLIIFTTAYDQYAVDAFKVHAIDYLLKPIEEERLKDAVEQAAERLALNQNNPKQAFIDLMVSAKAAAEPIEPDANDKPEPPAWPEKLAIKDGSDITLIRVADIEWIDAAGDYMCVHANGETHIMRITMRQLNDRLNPDQFLRIHRSTIVNSQLIAGAQALTNGEYSLSLSNGTKLKVSRSYRDTIKQFLSSH